jgi:predicted Zn finger-like uncharacterized protein
MEVSIMEEAVKIVCPTCNTSYNLQGDEIPQGKRPEVMCKKCGGQTVIESPSTIADSAEFEFIAGTSQFMGYAGFWKRFAAAIIDGFILMFAGFIIGGFIGAHALGNIAGIIMGWLYFAIMESSSKQGTLGKMILGIKVTDLYGNAISFGKATLRHFSKIISTIILLVGYLMVGFTAKKQALHDMIAGCLVVNRR